MDYTVEIWKLDRRYKEGKRIYRKIDYTDMALDVLEKIHPRRPGYIVLIHETWVLRKNMITDCWFRERYDTPYHCSPSSESYWSM